MTPPPPAAGAAPLLGIDLGTSAVKVALTTPGGDMIGATSAKYAVHHPRPGWAESAPRDWAMATAGAVRRLLRSHPGAPVSAIGVSGQMHGVVLTDDRLRAVRPAVLWPDGRAVEELQAYQELPERLRRRLANPIAEGMAGPTLRWFAGRPDGLCRVRWALQPKDWLRAWLTEEVATEPSDASATLLWDIPGDGWDAEVADRLGVPARLLAPVRASTAVAGGLATGAAVALRLPVGTPVVHGAADTAAGLEGGAVPRGSLQLSFGTGAQLVAHLDRLALRPMPTTHTFRTARPSGWYAMAAVKNAGLALRWVADLFGLGWEQFNDEAFAVPVGAGGVAFRPSLTGERTPWYDPGLRGAWTGLGPQHRRAHLLRASVDGVALAVADAAAALRDTGVDAPAVRLVGGGGRDPRWRRLLADALDRPLLAVPGRDASAVGAALIAGVGIGAGDWPAPVADDDLPVVAEPGPEAGMLAELRHTDR